MGSHSFLQGISLTQLSNLGLLHCRQIVYHLSHEGSPLHYISQCNNNRNKVHNKCNGLQSSWNHLPHSQSVEKLSSTKQVLGAKKVGDHSFKPVNSYSFIIAATGNEYGIKSTNFIHHPLYFSFPTGPPQRTYLLASNGRWLGFGAKVLPNCPKALGYPWGGWVPHKCPLLHVPTSQQS